MHVNRSFIARGQDLDRIEVLLPHVDLILIRDVLGLDVCLAPATVATTDSCNMLAKHIAKAHVVNCPALTQCLKIVLNLLVEKVMRCDSLGLGKAQATGNNEDTMLHYATMLQYVAIN